MNLSIYILIIFLYSVKATDEHLLSGEHFKSVLDSYTTYDITVDVQDNKYVDVVIFDGSKTIINNGYNSLYQVIDISDKPGYIIITNTYLYTDVYVKILIIDKTLSNIIDDIFMGTYAILLGMIFLIVCSCCLCGLCCWCCCKRDNIIIHNDSKMIVSNEESNTELYNIEEL